MQFLKIDSKTTLSSLTKQVGSRNIDSILSANGLKRTPNIGTEFADLCNKVKNVASTISNQKKQILLNSVTSDAEVFETTALLSESEWKVFATNGNYSNALKIPETIKLPNSTSIIGGSGTGVASTVYTKVMKCLQNNQPIDSSIFNSYSLSKPVRTGSGSQKAVKTDMFNAFNLPWGKIQLYSSLADEAIDFPVYPEEVQTSRKANYTTMPDTIYQYEPWYTYESSGPRDQEYTFHIHRDMWSGNHLDGKCNQLIRFCEANCYPKYSGSAVNTATVKMFINGALHISGIMTDVSVKWSGPLGQDGWYLDCELTLTITEVATEPLNYTKVKSISNIIGG